MTTNPEEAEAMVALVKRLTETDKNKHGYYGHVPFNRDGREAAAMITALARLRDDLDNARALLHSAYVAGYVQAEAGLPNHSDTHAAAKAAFEADRVKVAETALRMAAGVVEDHAPGGVHYEYGHDDGSMRVAIRSAILAITPAAVLAAVDSACNRE